MSNYKTYQPNLLILRPRLHDCCVVDRIHDDRVYSRLSERVLLLHVVRDLLGGSGGRKGPGQTQNDQRLVGGKLGQVVLLGRPSRVEFHRRKLVADSRQAAEQRDDCGSGKDKPRFEQGGQRAGASSSWLWWWQ